MSIKITLLLAQFADIILEVLLVDGMALYCRPVVVYRVGRVGEECGYLGALGDAKADEGEDAQTRGHRAVLVQFNIIDRFHQLRPLTHKIKL